MKLDNIELKNFKMTYDNAYRALRKYGRYYDGYTNITYDRALNMGDEILADENNEELIGQLVNERGDYFSSDMEVAALAIALLIHGYSDNMTYTRLPNWTNEDIEEIIEDFNHCPNQHIFYYPADDLLEVREHYLSNSTWEKDEIYDEQYSVDIFLKEHHLKLTTQNIRIAAEQIELDEEAFNDFLKEREEEEEREYYDPHEDDWED